MTGEDLFFNGVAMDNRTIRDDNTTMYSMDNATAWEISNETDNKWNMSLSGRDIYEMANELNEDVKVTTAPLHEIALELVKDGNSTSAIGSNLSVKAGIAQADSDGGDVFSFTMAVIFLLVLSFFTGRWFYERIKPIVVESPVEKIIPISIETTTSASFVTTSTATSMTVAPQIETINSSVFSAMQFNTNFTSANISSVVLPTESTIIVPQTNSATSMMANIIDRENNSIAVSASTSNLDWMIFYFLIFIMAAVLFKYHKSIYSVIKSTIRTFRVVYHWLTHRLRSESAASSITSFDSPSNDSSANEEESVHDQSIESISEVQHQQQHSPAEVDDHSNGTADVSEARVPILIIVRQHRTVDRFKEEFYEAREP